MSRAWLLNPYLAQKWQTGFTSCAYFRRGWLSTALCWGRFWSLPGLKEKALDDWSDVCATETRVTTMHLSMWISLHYFMFTDKNYCAIPPLERSPLISAWRVSLRPSSLLKPLYQQGLSWFPKVNSQGPSPSKHFIFSPFHLFIFSSLPLTTISYSYFVCLSPPLERKFQEGIWPLPYPQKLGQ